MLGVAEEEKDREPALVLTHRGAQEVASSGTWESNPVYMQNMLCMHSVHCSGSLSSPKTYFLGAHMNNIQRIKEKNFKLDSACSWLQENYFTKSNGRIDTNKPTM